MNGHLYKYLRLFRFWKNYKQAYVGELLNMSQSNYHKIETGERKLCYEHLEILAALYEMELADFVFLNTVELESFMKTMRISNFQKLNIEYLKLFKEYVHICSIYKHTPDYQLIDFTAHLEK